MTPNPISFNTLPVWAMPDQPHKLALWEVVALAGLEGEWIRLSAADQRALMGAVPFGKQSFRVLADGTVEVSRKTCFGNDAEIGEYSPSRVRHAVSQGLKISPGCFGPGML